MPPVLTFRYISTCHPMSRRSVDQPSNVVVSNATFHRLSQDFAKSIIMWLGNSIPSSKLAPVFFSHRNLEIYHDIPPASASSQESVILTCTWMSWDLDNVDPTVDLLGRSTLWLFHGKPWENHGKTIGTLCFHGILWDLPSGHLLQFAT